MGSAYPTIAADVLARYQRLAGRRVRFLTGTDEHGEKIALAAAARGLTPQDHCDGVVADYKALWAALDISNDGFVRTTDPGHEALVAEVLQRVWDRGDIYKAAYSGWYCVDCEEYKDEKELVDLSQDKGGSSSSSSSGEGAQHACPTHRKPCQHRWVFWGLRSSASRETRQIQDLSLTCSTRSTCTPTAPPLPFNLPLQLSPSGLRRTTFSR
jgi:methionyl-tRNA synthetase